jgi:hypothetical protein
VCTVIVPIYTYNIRNIGSYLLLLILHGYGAEIQEGG